MNLDDLSLLPKIVSKTHFAVFSFPKQYGLDEARAKLADKGVVFMEPKVHEKQKTETINADDIAELARIARTKQKVSLSIVVLRTEKMAEQAQNKFLKLLEEPNHNVHLVFVTEDASNLLPTVLSRAQVYNIKKISRSASLSLAKSLAPKADTKTLQQIMFLANGLPGEIKRLATEPKYLAEQAKLVDLAKQLLAGQEYEVIKAANQLREDRAQAVKVVGLAITIAKETLAKNPGFLTRLDQLEKAHEQLLANGNVRLSLVSNLV